MALHHFPLKLFICDFYFFLHNVLLLNMGKSCLLKPREYLAHGMLFSRTQNLVDTGKVSSLSGV